MRAGFQFVITVVMRGHRGRENLLSLCSRTSSAVKLFQDVLHINVTPWNGKVYYKSVETLFGIVETLFGRDCFDD